MIRFEPREIIPQNEYPDRDHIVTLSPPISFKVETLLNSCEMPVVNLQNTGLYKIPRNIILKQHGIKMVRALYEKGICMLVNHGVQYDKISDVFNCMHEYGMMGRETREKYLCDKSDCICDGYVVHGYDRFTKTEKCQEFRESYIVTGNKSKIPDKDVPGFSRAVESLTDDLKQMSNYIFKAIAAALDLPQDYFASKHVNLMTPESDSSIRLVYSPKEQMLNTGDVRCQEHTDFSTFTLYIPDSEGGMEVSLGGKRWIRVGHFPGAVIIMNGDIIQDWTKGTLKALRHRVVVPAMRGPSSALGFYLTPDKGADLQPIDITMPEHVEPTVYLQSVEKNKKKSGFIRTISHIRKRIVQAYCSF